LTIDPADVDLDVVGADVVNNATVQRQNIGKSGPFLFAASTQVARHFGNEQRAGVIIIAR
jgi:hypothetical protein